jgi:hypothetical protein
MPDLEMDMIGRGWAGAANPAEDLTRLNRLADLD